MIWTLKIRCIRGPYLEGECIRTIEIESESSLLHLHVVIQDAFEFERDHPFEFFSGRSYRDRKQVYGEEVEGDDIFSLYDNISLEKTYPLPESCKLFYHFDFGDDWYFEITKSRKMAQEPIKGVGYPRIVEMIGVNPEQYPSLSEE